MRPDPVQSAESIRTAQCAGPPRPILLDYATPPASRELRTPFAVKLWLLAGAAAVFLSFAETASPLGLTVDLCKAIRAGRADRFDLIFGAVGLALAMAIPMLLLVWVPRTWVRTARAVHSFCLSIGLLASCGAVYLELQLLNAVFFHGPPKANEWIVTSLYAGALVAGAVFVIRTWRRSRDLRHGAWMVLAASYIPTAMLCLWVFGVDHYSRPGWGYWLTLGNLIPATYQSIAILRGTAKRLARRSVGH